MKWCHKQLIAPDSLIPPRINVADSICAAQNCANLQTYRMTNRYPHIDLSNNSGLQPWWTILSGASNPQSISDSISETIYSKVSDSTQLNLQIRDSIFNSHSRLFHFVIPTISVSPGNGSDFLNKNKKRPIIWQALLLPRTGRVLAIN